MLSLRSLPSTVARTPSAPIVERRVVGDHHGEIGDLHWRAYFRRFEADSSGLIELCDRSIGSQRSQGLYLRGAGFHV